ncbi:TMV resistance protein N-like isoform X1 [Quercus lobata]|uniref:TMV resistance protein N-like isoform X1 n=1 Tax=Quercus lobata TaxID=97700 RepID=UPI001248F6D9|nr:TMV resistance protein N-like isoform X1 [Quercus lobata]
MENASSSSTVQWKYDVFISFRGEDTRNNFMDHLYNALIGKGINTFRDDEKLERGKPISLELLKAIEESRFTIVILSKDYASSPWCLDELAKIIACKEDMGMIVLPVFYYVEPSDVRKQMGTFAQAFVKHEEEEEKTRVDKWRDALRQVGNLAGWHLKDTRPESQDIQEIVGWILINLKYDAFPYITEDLVGIYSRLVELESCLALGSKDVLFIGIWGMGGIGKTTLARVVYHMVSKEFEARGFIEDVREKFEKNGCVSLQKEIIKKVLMVENLEIEEECDGVLKIKNRLCRKRVLLVLDDVHKLKQLKMLAGKRNWFGPGSRIIITTRDAHVLKAHRVNEIYEVKGLNNEDALQLLCLKALEKEHDLDDYIELSNHFLNYASGLPLALEVLGSFLCGKSIVEWTNALERLQEFNDEAILQVLEISFNGLQKSQKEIFLHIACFFNNQKKDYVLEILDILGLYPVIGLKELTDKSLLKIMDNDVVWMHDLLQEMGRNIVCQECLDDPGKRSRLWDYEDINKVLKKNKGTEALKAMDIASTCNEQQHGCWNPEAFLKMDNLKFLRINGTLPVPIHLPNDLRILHWISYPSKSLPSSYQLDELVQLCLQQSKIQQLWTGIKNFDKLKFIDLTDSLDLFITPDFTGVPNLETLVLVRCTNLREFHPSIGILKKLIHLNLQDCERLIRLPSKFGMESLVTLEISNCPKLKRIPKFVANPKFLQEVSLDRIAIVNLIKNLPENLRIIKGLEILDLSKADIEELPSSIERLTDLTSLTLRYCKNLVSLPNTICNLKLLKSLDLFGCLKFRNLPKNIGNVKGLELLNLCWTAIRDVPSSIALLRNLKHLYICRRESTESYSLPISLEQLGLVFPSLISANHVNPITVANRMHSTCCSQQPLQLLLPSLSGLQSLTYLHLSDLNLLSIPNDIGCLSSLEHLNLSGNDFVSLPESMSQLSNLRRFHLEGCKMLQSLENVPSTIDSVIANNCASLMRLLELQFYTFRSDHSHLNFQCVNCFKLATYIGSSGSMLQGQSGKLPDIFDIIIPDDHFPRRFKHESVSHKLKD